MINKSHSKLGDWGLCENIFSDSGLFLKQRKFRTQNTLAFCEQLNILKENSFLFFWAIQSTLGMLSFFRIIIALPDSHFFVPPSFSLKSIEDRRFELNYYYYSEGAARVKFGCLSGNYLTK